MAITFRGGRLPAHPEDTHPRLKLGTHLTGLAVPPASADWYSLVTDWPMYGNDQIGDCTCACTGHIIESSSRYGEGSAVEVPDAEVLAEYERVGGYVPGDPSTDNGAVIQDVLSDWRKTGVAGHKCLVYAEVSLEGLGQVQQAIALFGVADLGITVTQDMMDAFNNGQPWTSGSGTQLGGHCVPAVGYDAQNVYVVTWGKVQAMTWGCFAAVTEEAWAAVTPEWFSAAGEDPEGVDLHGLGEEFAELTGQPNPFPQPPPTPPNQAPNAEKRLAELAALIRKDAARAEAWLRLHHL